MVKIRNFRDGDTPLIMDFCQKEDPLFVDLDTFRTSTEFERLVLKRDPWESSFDPNGCFLAFEGKKLIGFAKAHINKPFVEAHGMDVGFISPGWPWSPLSLAVHHCYRGEGLHSMLLNKCLNYLHEGGMEYAQTCINVECASGRLFLLKHGFKMFRRVISMRRDLREPISEPRFPTEYSLKTFEIGGEAKLIDCHNRVFKEEWAFLPRTVTGFVNSFEKHPDFDPSGFFNLVFENKIVGFSWNLVNKSKKVGKVSSLGILKEHRRKGLGKALLSKSLLWLKKRGMNCANLETHEDYLVGFYEKSRFKKIEEWTVLRKKI